MVMANLEWHFLTLQMESEGIIHKLKCKHISRYLLKLITDFPF